MSTPAGKVRELCAHMLQLCHYLDELTAAGSLVDVSVINEKVRQTRQAINELYEEA